MRSSRGSANVTGAPTCGLRRRRGVLALALALAGCDALGLGKTGDAEVAAPTPTPDSPKPAAPRETPTPTPAPPTTPPALPSLEDIITQAKSAGEDRTKLEAALAQLDARLAAQPSAQDHYVRAQILDRLQRREDALAALDASLRLDPSDVEAHHLAGLLAADLGRDADALVHWSAAANGKPPHPGAAYNAGQYLYNNKRFDEALAMWRITLAANPDDFDAAKKIVQAFNALGKHDDAETAKEQVRRIFASSTDAGVKHQNEVVIDQLVVDGHQVMIRETLVPKDASLHYHWIATVYAADGKTPELTVQLESSQYGREAGVPFLNGITRGSTHSTWGAQFAALPAYADWRAAAVEKIAAEV